MLCRSLGDTGFHGCSTAITELMPSRLLLCGAAGQSPGNLEAGGDPAMVGVRGWGCRRTEGFVLTRDVRGKEGVGG